MQHHNPNRFIESSSCFCDSAMGHKCSIVRVYKNGCSNQSRYHNKQFDIIFFINYNTLLPRQSLLCVGNPQGKPLKMAPSRQPPCAIVLQWHWMLIVQTLNEAAGYWCDNKNCSHISNWMPSRQVKRNWMIFHFDKVRYVLQKTVAHPLHL